MPVAVDVRELQVTLVFKFIGRERWVLVVDLYFPPDQHHLRATDAADAALFLVESDVLSPRTLAAELRVLPVHPAAVALLDCKVAPAHAPLAIPKLKFGFWSGDTPPTQFYPAVNFTKIGLTPPAQEIERLKSNMEGSVGQDLRTVQKPTEDSDVKFTGEFTRAPRTLMALAIGATPTELTQSTATVTDEAVTLAVGLWVPLANAYLASFTGLKTAADATVAAANYEVDLVDGMIMALNSTGATGTKATYVKDDVAGVQYDAGKALSEYCMIRGTATDKSTETRGRLIIHKANLAPSGEWDVVAGGFLTGVLEGSCETPSASGYTRTSPYQFFTTDIAA